MEKDPRFIAAKYLIEARQITSLRGILPIVPKSAIATGMGINFNRMSRLLEAPEQFSIEELKRLADLIEIDHELLIKMVLDEYTAGEKKVKKKQVP